MATVRIFGPTIQTVITGPDGRFGFVVSKGSYDIKAERTNYISPSKYILGKSDSLYDNLYFGDKIKIKEDKEVVNCNIPMDHYLLKVKGKISFNLSSVRQFIAYLSLVLILISAFYALFLYNLQKDRVFLSLSLLFFLLFIVNLRNLIKTKRFKLSLGLISDISGKPIEGATIKLIEKKTKKLIETRKSSPAGEYTFFVQPGKYILKTEKENYIFLDKEVKVIDPNNPYIKENIYGEYHAGYFPH
ncbi:MAG: hypothetical protein GTN40_01710 [Candidatus Aenigmarchaeota archaeon]|nr:hypothetical protein [Candidatus Aenigmarchaeota archaeon]